MLTLRNYWKLERFRHLQWPAWMRLSSFLKTRVTTRLQDFKIAFERGLYLPELTSMGLTLKLLYPCRVPAGLICMLSESSSQDFSHVVVKQREDLTTFDLLQGPLRPSHCVVCVVTQLAWLLGKCAFKIWSHYLELGWLVIAGMQRKCILQPNLVA